MTSDEPINIESERSARIRELETRLSQKSPIGVKPMVSGLALAACLGMLFMMRLDIAYFFSSSEPVSLGSEGQYRLQAIPSNRYVELHGQPTLRGTFGQDKGKVIVMVGVRDTPIALVRGALETEPWKPGSVPAQPDQRPFLVRGRLLARADADRYEADGFQKLSAMGEVSPQWVLIEGAKPGNDVSTFMQVGLLAALAAMNAWLLKRGLTPRRTA